MSDLPSAPRPLRPGAHLEPAVPRLRRPSVIARLLVSLPATGLVWWAVEYFLLHRSGRGLFLASVGLLAALCWHGMAQGLVSWLAKFAQKSGQ